MQAKENEQLPNGFLHDDNALCMNGTLKGGGWEKEDATVLFALIGKEKRYFGRITTAFSEYSIANLEHWCNARAASEHADMSNLLRCDATALRFFETDLELAISLCVYVFDAFTIERDSSSLQHRYTTASLRAGLSHYIT